MKTYITKSENNKVELLKLLKAFGYWFNPHDKDFNPEKEILIDKDWLVIATSDKSLDWTRSNINTPATEIGIGELVKILFTPESIKGKLGKYDYEIKSSGECKIGCQKISREQIEQFIKFYSEQNNFKTYYQMKVSESKMPLFDFCLESFFEKFGFKREDTCAYPWIWFDFASRYMTGNNIEDKSKKTINLQEFITLALNNNKVSFKLNEFIIIFEQNKNTEILIRDVKNNLILTITRNEIEIFISNYKSIVK